MCLTQLLSLTNTLKSLVPTYSFAFVHSDSPTWTSSYNINIRINVRASNNMGTSSKDKTSKKTSVPEEGQETEDNILSDDSLDTTLQGGSHTSLGSASVPEKRSHPMDAEGDKESKKSRRSRLANTDIMDVIQNSAATETIISVEELLQLKDLIATLAKDNARVQEEITSLKNQPLPVKSDTAYGFFNDVLLLQSSADVTKPKIFSVISQFRNPLFSRTRKEIIQHRAARVIDFEFTTEGYASSQEVIDAWTDAEYIDNLEKLYQNNHLDTTTLNRFAKINLSGLYVPGKISTSLVNSLLEADELMTEEDRSCLSLQKSLINRAHGHLSQLEPARINLAPSVAQCTTFKEYLLLWFRYKSEKQTIVDNLTADGYTVGPKSYLLSGSQKSDGKANGNANKHEKKDKSNHVDRSASTLVKTPGTIKLDPKYEICNGCGRQEYDEKQKAAHSYSNCFLRLHPNWNSDPAVKWKDSVSGKAFAALVPPFMFLPYTYLKDGSKRDLPNRGNLICNDCIYLVSLKNNFLKPSSNTNFLSLTLLSVRLPSQETVKLSQRSIHVRGLLDSGSLWRTRTYIDVLPPYDHSRATHHCISTLIDILASSCTTLYTVTKPRSFI
jgi:hypothetical protein